MGSYPPDQNTSGIDPRQDKGFGFGLGSSCDSMNTWQKAALLSNPRALQIMQYVQQLGAQKEERDRRRQIFQMDLEDRQRQRAHEDLATAITLHGAGLMPSPATTPEADLKVRQAFNMDPSVYREPIQVGGKTYRFPSQSDQEERALEKQQTAAAGEYQKAYSTAKGRAAGEDATAVEMDFGDAGKIKVPRTQFISALRLQQDLKANKYSAHTFQKDDNGNTTFVGIPQNGGEPVKVSLGAIGTTKTVKTNSGGIMTPRAERAFNEAQGAIDLAKAGPKATKQESFDEKIKREMVGGDAPDQVREKEAQRLWKIAEDKVAKAVAAHPDELEGGKGDGGLPFIVPKQNKSGVTTIPPPTANVADQIK